MHISNLDFQATCLDAHALEHLHKAMFGVIFVPVGCTVLEFSSVLSNVSQCGEIEHARITAKLFGLATALN